VFVTSEGSAVARFQRAIKARDLSNAELTAYELHSPMALGFALDLLVLYAETGSDKFEKAAVRWLGKLLTEKPMPLAIAAQAVELVAALRGPGKEGAAAALASLARP